VVEEVMENVKEVEVEMEVETEAGMDDDQPSSELDNPEESVEMCCL
jgi:hypothetical protein